MGLDQRLTEFRQTLKTDFVAGVEAANFLKLMQVEHPAELEEWLHTHAQRFVAEALNRQLNVERAAAIRSASTRRFAEAAASGDPKAMSVFAMTFVVDTSSTRRRLGEMRAAECRFVADRYEAQGNRELALAALMRALAKEIGDKKVEDVIAPERLSRMFASFLRPDQSDGGDDLLQRLAATA